MDAPFYPSLYQINTRARLTELSRAGPTGDAGRRSRRRPRRIQPAAGTKFGLMTDGNVAAIPMSLPPEARWP
jgi:coproporphyrinogen III oxidase